MDNCKDCPACGDSNPPNDSGALGGMYQHDCWCGETYHSLPPASAGVPLPWELAQDLGTNPIVTGFPVLDEAAGGLRPGELVVLAVHVGPRTR